MIPITQKNFMKHSFKHYFAPDGNGGYKEVERKECFAYDKDSFSGAYRQQWYWDPEKQFCIRLERNANGNKAANEAQAERRLAAKQYREAQGYVHTKCQTCKGWAEVVDGNTKCDTCNKHVKFVALDKNFDTPDSDKPTQLEISGDTDIERETESAHLLETLTEVLQTLDCDEQALWQFLVLDTKKNVIAAHFGWTLDQLSYRQLKLYKKLRANNKLKKFFHGF